MARRERELAREAAFEQVARRAEELTDVTAEARLEGRDIVFRTEQGLSGRIDAVLCALLEVGVIECPDCGATFNGHDDYWLVIPNDTCDISCALCGSLLKWVESDSRMVSVAAVG